MLHRRQPYDQRKRYNLRRTNRICERVHTFTSREQLISTIESYIDYYNNRRYQHRLFIQTPMQAHVSAMNRAA